METDWITIKEAATRFPSLGDERIRQLAAGGKIRAKRTSHKGWEVDPDSISEYLAQPKRGGGRPRKNGAPAPVALSSPLCPICNHNPAGVGGVPCGDCMAQYAPAPPPDQRALVVGIMGKIARWLGSQYFHVTGAADVAGYWIMPHPDAPPQRPSAPVPAGILDIPGPVNDEASAYDAWRQMLDHKLDDPGFDYFAWLAGQQQHGFNVDLAVLRASGWNTATLERAIQLGLLPPGAGPLGDVPQPDPLLAAPGPIKVSGAPGANTAIRLGETLEAPPAPAPAETLVLDMPDPDTAPGDNPPIAATPSPPAGEWQTTNPARCACPGCGHAKMQKHHYQNGRRRCPTCIIANCQPGRPLCDMVPTEDMGAPDEGVDPAVAGVV